MANSKLQVITTARPFGGWISTLSGTGSGTAPAAALEGNTDQYTYSVAISLFRLEKMGHIAPGEVLNPITDSNSYITALAMNGDVASTGNSFIVLQNGRVIETFTDGSSVIDYIVPTAHAANTISTSVNVDTIVIKDAASTPNEYVIATWQDSGNTADAMIFKVGTNGAWSQKKSDWFSGGSSANYLVALASPGQIPHKMCQGPDGNVYITNGQYIAAATMAAGVSLGASTNTPQALNLGAGWVSTGIVPYKNWLAIIGHKATTYISGVSRSLVRVWLWDGFSGDPRFIFDIPDNFANGIYFDGKELFAFTSGRNNTGKIHKFNGSSFELLFENGFANFSSNFLQGSMETYQNSVLMGYMSNSEGHLRQWFQNGFHDRTILKDSTTSATAVGMVKNLYVNQLFVGVTVGGTNKILYQNQFTQYYVGAGIRLRLIDTPYKSKHKKTIIYFSQFGSGASLEVNFFKDYSSPNHGGSTDEFRIATGTPLQIDNAHLGAVSAWVIEKEITDINSLYMDINFNHTSTSATAAIIRKIETYIETTDQV